MFNLSTPIDLGSFNDELARKAVPLIKLFYDEGGLEAIARLGIDTSLLRLDLEETREAIAEAAFEFSKATNATTSQKLGDALTDLRRALETGVITEGQRPLELVRAVNKVFDEAEFARAERLAITESSRALHAGQRLAGLQSGGVVKGYKWLLSADPCPLCIGIEAKFSEGIDVTGGFGTVQSIPGFENTTKHPVYSNIPHPPAHPHCMCTVVETINEAALTGE